MKSDLSPSAAKPTLTVGADCFLSGIPASFLPVLKNELTIANPKYTDAKKYGRWMGKKLKPFLYFYEEVAGGLRFPRGFANQAILLCRRYLSGITPVIVDRRLSLPEIDFNFSGELRDYQLAAFNDIVNREFGVLESGTGSGKTIIALAVIAHRRQPTLILVHTKELLYQWAERVREFLGLEAGLIGDGHNEPGPVSVGIVNTVGKQLDMLADRFGQICVDECHRVPATLFTDVVTSFSGRYSLGLSATAYRRDGLTNLIYFYLGDRCHRVNQATLHESGAVLKPEFIQRETAFSYNYRGSYQNLMSALVKDEERNRQIVGDIVAETRREPGTILVVSDRVAHCEMIAKLLVAEGSAIKLAVLTGKLASDERTAIVEAIHKGELSVLISTLQLIGEGFDCEGLRALFLTTPIKFSGRLLQVVGRILRPAVGKQPRVYDYVDQVGLLKKSAQARRLTYLEG
ncbi:MAG: DEAD/DEAH box helicase [Proteobacteria bacterium]|nr:DEAD/DEAH box helicase [Pseudomonadota bacterium]MBU1715056.1 DEAD/DEAH box helicase [Pseudomonadota bacterium]